MLLEPLGLWHMTRCRVLQGASTSIHGQSTIRHYFQEQVGFTLYFSGGMFALGAEGSSDSKKYLVLGEELANTCHEAYIRTGNESYWRLKLIYKLSVFKRLHSPNFPTNHKRNSNFTMLWYSIRITLIDINFSSLLVWYCLECITFYSIRITLIDINFSSLLVWYCLECITFLLEV